MPQARRLSRTEVIWIQSSTSTKWPGITRFAIAVALLAFLVALAQCALGAYLTYLFLRVSRVFTCMSDQSDDAVLVTRPLNVLNIEDGDGFGINKGTSNFTAISTALLLPLAITLLTSHLLYAHLSVIRNRPRGLRIRTAMLVALILLVLWTIAIVADLFIKIDTALVGDWDVCWVERLGMERLVEGRKTRDAVFLGREWVSIAAVLCLIVYITLAVYAIHLNQRDAEVQEQRARDLELPTLPSPSRQLSVPPPGLGGDSNVTDGTHEKNSSTVASGHDGISDLRAVPNNPSALGPTPHITTTVSGEGPENVRDHDDGQVHEVTFQTQLRNDEVKLAARIRIRDSDLDSKSESGSEADSRFGSETQKVEGEDGRASIESRERDVKYLNGDPFADPVTRREFAQAGN